jgi:DNA-binding transcriptional ArsR family regulator
LPNDAIGRTFVQLGDPVKRAIIEELLIADHLTPAQLATEMHARFAIGRAAVSTHITQLEDARVLTRERDRTVRLINAHGMQILVLEAHRVASTADASAAIITEALRANLEERLQDRQSSRPDISAFFASQPTGPSFETDGPIQRPEALDAPQAQALSKDRWRLKMYWVRTRPPGQQEEMPRHSTPAFYHPPPAHIVIINADWPPLTRLVERHSERTRPADVWESIYPLIEREVADALAAAFHSVKPDSDDLNAAMHERLTKRLPHIERRLQDAVGRRPHESS